MAAVLHFTTFLVLLSSACCRDPQLGSPGGHVSYYQHEARFQDKDVDVELREKRDRAGMQTRHPAGLPHHAKSTGQRKQHLFLCIFQLRAAQGGHSDAERDFCWDCIPGCPELYQPSWTPGPAAPADVQYHLYAWASTNEDEAECPHYTTDSTGTRVGCHFHKLGKPKRTDNYFFLVNGTSRETAVQFLDFTPFVAYKIEKYNPPENITVYDNESHHIIQWDNPEIRFDIATHMLYYKLDIQKKGSNSKIDPIFQRGEDKNVYLLPSSAMRAESTFRARVRYVHNKLWSEWSSPLHFGHAELRSSRTTAALAGLVAGVVLTVTVLMFLCKRFSLKQRLLPPIPQVRREVTGSLPPHLEVSWDGDSPPPGSHKPEDILLVEETQ
ncbi:granulocyte-macrophage colony-stimulating factor receptor subunit alpha-like isoform X3 [Manis javanica]|uniref:granulocyte-macrophage colony-stimulating factor receptor subunit alpha-like isoform X3 n=1 Tax=Manis javanica TaxID=9974 RepID=UPI003C6D5D34